MVRRQSDGTLQLGHRKKGSAEPEDFAQSDLRGKGHGRSVFIAKGGVVPTHQHESEQLTYILEGALKLLVEGKEVVVRKGEVLLIPSNVPHSAVAMEDTVDLDIFSPIRMDWLTGTDDYLRKG